MRRDLLPAGALLLLMLGASTVFSQGPGPTTPDDPSREVLILKKAALEAEIKAGMGRIEQARRRLKNAEVGLRSGMQGVDYVMNARVDLLEREAVVARKRVELKLTTNRIEGHAQDSTGEGSIIDVTDDLLRRIKDLEVRVDRIDASGREFRLRSPGGSRGAGQSMFLD